MNNKIRDCSLRKSERQFPCSCPESDNASQSSGREDGFEKEAAGSSIVLDRKNVSIDQSDRKKYYFVEDFLKTVVGLVPRVSSDLSLRDFWGVLRVRLGIRRNDYRVEPGLYAVGSPPRNAPVLVTANFKLTFDHLRHVLKGFQVWILVLDTCGINVWCAAGKKTFSSEELIFRIKSCGLKSLVSHCQLILPQLGASGVSAFEVKEKSGFSVVWGPVRAVDLPEFLKNGYLARERMRMVTFFLRERLALIPVEIKNAFKPSLFILAGIFILSGVERDGFSLSLAWLRGGPAVLAFLLGICSGAMVVPILLAWIPCRMFYVKGLVAGVPIIILGMWSFFPLLHSLEIVALVFLSLSVSSYTAMNFTGSTPFTSPSGVRKEVRQGLLIQSLLMLGAVVLWLFAGFRG